MKLFDYLNSINTKTPKIDNWTGDNYSPFMINRGLSQHYDTAMIAQLMNEHPDIPSEFHYKVLYQVVPKKKRYGKWAKGSKDELSQLLAEREEINIRRAKDYISILTDDQIKELRQSLETGGRR